MSWATDGGRPQPMLPGQEGRPSASAAKLPGAASLFEQVDKQILVCLRDGRNFLGRLASYDQYANLVLDGAVERIVVDGCYADVPFGIFVVRGENVMLLGETDAEKETQLGERLTNVTEAEIRRALAAQKEDSDSFNRGDKFEWPILEEFWYVRARTALAAALGATAERRTDDHLASVPRTADSAHRDLSTESARAVPCGAARGGADEQATAPSGCQCKQCTPTVCAG